MPADAPARARVARLVVFALMLLHAALAWFGMAEKGVTYDEIAHLAAGAAYNAHGDFRLQPENGNLPQRLAGAAVLAAGHAAPGPVGPAWQQGDVWELGHRLLFTEGHDPVEVLAAARLPFALVGALLVLLVYRASRARYGVRGGLLSATVAAFSPTLLAAAGLATSDLLAATLLLSTTLAFDALLRRVTPSRFAASSLSLGLLALTKVSVVLMGPVALLLGARAVGREAPMLRGHGAGAAPISGRASRVLWIGGLLVAHAVVAWLLLWPAYGFRYDAFAPDTRVGGDSFYGGGWPHVERVLEEEWRPLLATALLLRDEQLVPEAWAYGLAFVDAHSRARAAYLDGEVRYLGFGDFFPRAFAYKTPVAVLLLIVLALLSVPAGSRRRAGGRNSGDGGAGDGVPGDRDADGFAPLALLLVAAGAALTTPLNIGHRHLLPVYAALFVLLGAAGRWLEPGAAGPRRVAAALTRASVALLVVTTLVAWPHLLAFFNLPAGGRDAGWRHLVDSSLDWGQDLPGLATWLERRRPADDGLGVYLSYFGKDDPERLGLSAHHLPFVPDDRRKRELLPLGAGVYAISATMLSGVYSPFPAPWSAEDERLWNEARAHAAAFDSARADPVRLSALLARDGEELWQRRMAEFEQLRFARLCAALRRRTPNHVVGGSILIHELDGEQVKAAIFGPPVELGVDPTRPGP